MLSTMMSVGVDDDAEIHRAQRDQIRRLPAEHHHAEREQKRHGTVNATIIAVRKWPKNT